MSLAWGPLRPRPFQLRPLRKLLWALLYRFCSSCRRISPEFSSRLHSPANRLTAYEVLPLTAPHIILWHFNALNLAALLLSSTDRLAMIAQCWQTTSWRLMVNYRIFHWVIRTLTSPGSLTVLTEKATIASTVLEMLLDLFSMLLSSVFIYGYFGPTD